MVRPPSWPRPGWVPRSPCTRGFGVPPACGRPVRGVQPTGRCRPEQRGACRSPGPEPDRGRRAALFVEEFGRAPLDDRERAGFLARLSRQSTTAAAGYDLTFSPVKSVSALWASKLPASIAYDCHHRAPDGVGRSLARAPVRRFPWAVARRDRVLPVASPGFRPPGRRTAAAAAGSRSVTDPQRAHQPLTAGSSK